MENTNFADETPWAGHGTARCGSSSEWPNDRLFGEGACLLK